MIIYKFAYWKQWVYAHFLHVFASQCMIFLKKFRPYLYIQLRYSRLVNTAFPNKKAKIMFDVTFSKLQTSVTLKPLHYPKSSTILVHLTLKVFLETNPVLGGGGIRALLVQVSFLPLTPPDSPWLPPLPLVLSHIHTPYTLPVHGFLPSQSFWSL